MSFLRKPAVSTVIFIMLIVIENLCVLYFPTNGKLHQTRNATAFFMASSLVGVFLLYKFYKRPVLTTLPGQSNIIKKYVPFVLFAAGLVWLNMESIGIYKQFAVPGQHSDIIPLVTVLAKRFLAGQYPYSADALKELYYDTPSGYMPAHWMPYTIAEHFHFDYRTITFCIWAIAAGVLMFRAGRIQSLAARLLAPVLLIGSYHYICVENPGIIAATVELMVAGYYMLFVTGISQRNAFITALLMSVCLLSRYYIALWMPFWAIIMLMSGDYKAFFKTSVWVAVFISLGYIIPFLSKDWSSFYTAYVANYEKVPFNEWTRINPNLQLPYQLSAGTGFAHLFYKHYAADPKVGFLLLKKVMFIASLSSLGALAVFYWFNKSKFNVRIFLLASFKIYLAVFLGFVMVPYTYLMITSIFVSVAIFIEQARYEDASELQGL